MYKKERDPITGKILSILPADSSRKLNGETVIIKDDICDGGGTFIPVAKDLRGRGAGLVGLYVTHGIFSKGFSSLYDYIDFIITTDSYYSAKSPAYPTSYKFMVYELNPENISR